MKALHTFGVSVLIGAGIGAILVLLWLFVVETNAERGQRTDTIPVGTLSMPDGIRVVNVPVLGGDQYVPCVIETGSGSIDCLEDFAEWAP